MTVLQGGHGPPPPIRSTCANSLALVYRGLVTLSTALLVLTVIAWVWGYRKCQMVAYHSATGTSHEALSQRGALYLVYPFGALNSSRGWDFRTLATRWTAETVAGSTPNRWIPMRITHSTYFSVLVISYWFLALVFAALPAWATWQWTRRKPRGRGFYVEAARPLK